MGKQKNENNAMELSFFIFGTALASNYYLIVMDMLVNSMTGSYCKNDERKAIINSVKFNRKLILMP